MLEPKISFVVAARNDDYGGNFLRRMQVFVDGLLTLWQRHRLDAELVVVEWNPPGDKPCLTEAIHWPTSVPPGRLRVIEVPATVHRRLPGSDRIPMFEFIAKNVGIRRARGEYVLATNADIIFNEELINFLASAELSLEHFYRIDRYDVGALVPLDLSVDEQLRFCADNTIRVRSAMGTIPLSYLTTQNSKTYRDYLQKLTPRGALRWFMTKFVFRLHTGAPGDFTLMARERWHQLRSYPELAAHKSHLDCYLCSMSKALGLRQSVLKDPMRIYHQEHGYAKSGGAETDYEVYWRDTMKMWKSGRPLIQNSETWGLGDEELPETAISQPRGAPEPARAGSVAVD